MMIYSERTKEMKMGYAILAAVPVTSLRTAINAKFWKPADPWVDMVNASLSWTLLWTTNQIY